MLRATLKQQVTLQERHIASTGTLISKKQTTNKHSHHAWRYQLCMSTFDISVQ